MADIKAYISYAKRLLIADGTHFSAPKPDPERRVASLDIFRGLTVAVCIYVSLKRYLLSLF
jgi:heparan-alpha-glucosaminide N-acetyltransferase